MTMRKEQLEDILHAMEGIEKKELDEVINQAIQTFDEEISKITFTTTMIERTIQRACAERDQIFK